MVHTALGNHGGQKVKVVKQFTVEKVGRRSGQILAPKERAEQLFRKNPQPIKLTSTQPEVRQPGAT